MFAMLPVPYKLFKQKVLHKFIKQTLNDHNRKLKSQQLKTFHNIMAEHEKKHFHCVSVF